MGLLLLFVDGFGIGENDPKVNPLVREDYPTITRLLREEKLANTDASLGIPGIPQSATGQTTLLTGVNGGKAIGKHLSGFPSPSLIKIILQHSILKKLKDNGYKVTNANLYTKDYPYPKPGVKFRGSATTVSTIAAGIPFRKIQDYPKIKAVFHDITNKSLVEKGFSIPIIEPEEAGQVLVSIVDEHDFTLFEYFKTDKEGHKGFDGNYHEVLSNLDRFINSIIGNLNLSKDTILIASDHGNIEDLRIKTHTMNNVPTIAIGNKACEILKNIKKLEDVSPSIYRFITGKDVGEYEPT